MLIGYMSNSVKIDLHSGGSFDYLFVMRKRKIGLSWRNVLMMYYLEGLLEIIKKIELNAIPETVSIVGTSYFFNERTAKKIGFELQTPSVLYRFNLFLNFIDLIWMYSASRGRFSIPTVWKARKVGISGMKLVENKNYIEGLYKRIKSQIK